MKQISKIFALGAALVFAAPLAHATSIDATFGVAGTGSYTYNPGPPVTATFSFVPPEYFATVGGSSITPYYSAVTASPNTNSSISFSTSPFTLGPVGTNIVLGTPFAIATSTHNGETLTFYVTSYIASSITPTTAGVDGTGYFTETGVVNYDQTNAIFSFAPSKTGSSMTFSANTNTVATTPEPSSLVLLGSGLVSAAGMLIRRRRIA